MFKFNRQLVDYLRKWFAKLSVVANTPPPSKMGKCLPHNVILVKGGVIRKENPFIRVRHIVIIPILENRRGIILDTHAGRSPLHHVSLGSRWHFREHFIHRKYINRFHRGHKIVAIRDNQEEECENLNIREMSYR